MPTFEVWKDMQKPGRCRGCGARLTWAHTVTGNKWMPLTGFPAVLHEHETEDGRSIQVIDSKESHFATCPAADRFSRKKSE